MEKLFENKTTYNTDTYLEFLEFHSKTNNIKYIAYTAFWTLFILIGIYVAFSSGSRFQGIILTLGLIAFILYRIYKPQKIVNDEMNSDKFTENNTNTFTFYNQNFKVENKNGSFIYRYFMLRKVYETDNYIYLYVTSENAFLIDKDSFTYGTKEDFSEFIKKKCKLRFKKK